MLRSPSFLLTVVLAFLPAAGFALARPAVAVEAAGGGPTIAVADFSGPDRELGRLVADTLLTDLARSDRLRLVERTEIRQALAELKLQATGLVEPQQVRRLGKLVSADHLIVGGCVLRGDQVIINARLLDVRTGRLAPGGAANASGSQDELLAVVHRLARTFHRRVTGSDLTLDDEEGSAPAAAPSMRHAIDVSQPERPVASGGRPNAVLTERDLQTYASRLARSMRPRTQNPVTTTAPRESVNRARALAALVKLAVSAEDIASYRHTPAQEVPPDASTAPAWVLPYIAASVELGWWPADRALRPRDPATWAFVESVSEHLPLDTVPPAASARVVRAVRDADPGAYTGLIVDAYDLRLQRSICPRIVDEDGRVVYPDRAYLPDDDFLQDRGMASYYAFAAEAERAGSRPLVVRAIDTCGPGYDDVVVSRAAANRILEANRSGRFLSRWAVCILSERR